VRLLNRGKGPASEIAMRMPSGECSRVTLKIRQPTSYNYDQEALTEKFACAARNALPVHSSQMPAAALPGVSPCDATRLLNKATAAAGSLDSN